MSATQLPKLNDFHLKFARWILENPEKRLADAKLEFGYSIPWLSVVANSDAFKAHLLELNAASDAMIVADVPTKLRGVAGQALEALGEQLNEAITTGPAHRVDRDFVKSTAEMALKHLGYGAKQGVAVDATPTVQINITQMQEARERILRKGRADVPAIEVIANALPAPENAV